MGGPWNKHLESRILEHSDSLYCVPARAASVDVLQHIIIHVLHANLDTSTSKTS